ncbi:DEAD/DEAH box helicase [Halorientalis salina]|uniref:DEAD/DEAH box helicase n=1 Tax=Halorientalis salina TaxID=2932266 RepID=UPI0010AD1B16|nr:DEAD/DEAH box helicase [Halorientalis salina]
MSGIAGLPADDAEVVEEIMDAHGYDSLKETQQLAFEDGILNPGNHLLVAETGNGKTLCAETVTKKHLEQDGRVAYLVPSRQLVRDKRESMQEWGADEYRIYSGPSAYQTGDVIVATFDSFYRAILQDKGSARNLDLVVLDDFHEIYGGFRGPAIEKAIAAAQYEGIEIFAMSATLGNPDELADWMGADLTISPEGRQIEIEEEAIQVGEQEKKEALVNFIQTEQDKAPFLVFNYAKPWTESRAKAIAKTRLFSDASDRDFLAEMEKKVNGEITSTLEDLARLMDGGVAFHHADLPQEVRHWIEDLYDEGEIQCLCATTTIAYGFDSPVQSVVVADIKRGPSPVGVYEYVQWIGRAARPGYGYDKGYAFTLTDDPEETIQRYFEPHRELEPVTTHIENQVRFRWLLLELIVTEWDTPHEIEAFIKEMLYWQQMKQIGAWGREHGSKDERLNDRLRQTSDWQIEHDFTAEKDTARQFQPTALGEGAVDFAFNSFSDATLSAIRTFYDWLEAVPNDEITKAALIYQSTLLADRSLDRNCSGELEGLLQENDLPVDKYGITAGVLRWYWIKNLDTRKIENQTGVDGAYISSEAGRIADTLDATKHLIDASPDIRRPDWFDILSFRVDRGVRRDEVPLVENVRGLGRHRIRMLRQYLNRPGTAMADEIPDASLWEQVIALYKAADSPDFFEDLLNGNVSGIGNKTAERLRKFVESGSVDEQYLEKETNNAEFETTETQDSNTDFTRGTSLDDFSD